MAFKDAIAEYGKEITASFVCGGLTYDGDRVLSMNPHYDGALLSSVMRCMDIELDGLKELSSSGSSENVSAVVGDAVVGVAVAGIAENSGDTSKLKSVKFGVKAPGDSDYSYIEYGTYIIKEAVYDDELNSLKLECYDLMLQSMVPYDISLDYSGGDITVATLLDAICTRLGWTAGYTTFTNSTVVIEEEKYDSTYTFRDVLDQIAQVAGGVIAFVGDKLNVLYPTQSGETIDASNLKTLKIGEKYGPVNSIVIARTPQEDNIYKQDTASIDANGLTEIKIENNQIMDSHREDFIDGIYSRLYGLEYYLYELDSFGIGYLDLCDVFTLETLDGSTYSTIMLSDDLQITQSVSETSRLEAPEETETDYEAASETDRLINKTILRVDKQQQTIAALVSSTENVQSEVDGLSQTVTNMSEVMIDSDSVDIKISTAVAGIDSVTTSTGYTFNQDGLNIHKEGEEINNTLDNTGMYVKRNDESILTANKDGVDAINLTSRQYLIVGSNSRFENYDNGTDANRTACFYIGGE